LGGKRKQSARKIYGKKERNAFGTLGVGETIRKKKMFQWKSYKEGREAVKKKLRDKERISIVPAV